MQEVWKQIEGYNGKYEISNLGRLKSYAQSRQGKIKTGTKEFKGYLVVRLYDDFGNPKDFKIHRLVAEAFIPNPENLPQVNHKDEHKENNCVDNLEWCDNTYNHNYGSRNHRAGEKNRCHPSTSIRVYSIDEDGNIEEFASIGDAERVTGIYHSNIIRVLRGDGNTAGGFKWCYA